MDARTSRYHEVYARWQRDPQGFWREAAQDIDWIEPPSQVFDPHAGVYGRWFTGGVCNTCLGGSIQSMSCAASRQKPSGSRCQRA